MRANQARMEFAPPPTPGLVRSVALAIMAHAVLLAILATGVQWKHQAPVVTVEAELWSALPQEAAPPAPVPEPEPEPVVLPPIPQEAPSPKPIPAEPLPDPAIAIAQEKLHLQKEKDTQLQLQKLELEKKKFAKLEQEKRLKEKLQTERLKREKEMQDTLAREKAAADKKKVPDVSAAEAKKLAELRQQNLQRMAGLAAGTGAANSSASAAQASGPSAGYGGRIRARIRPNITFTDSTFDNPTAEVEVRTSPDGTIISRKLTKPSGVKSWDEAVLNAIDKTEVLPKDVDGRVPTSLIISFQPKD